MAANENTKFQINYKLADGTLINLYATDVKDLETGLTDLSMVAALIKSTSSELSGGNATAAAVTNIQAAFNATPVNPLDDRANPAAQPGAKQCRHGVMAFKTGTSARGPWQGYMCAAPKGALDKCETIWVR
jgi:hypothetical protein